MENCVKKINEEKFKEIISQNKIVLVDFFATWCGPCKMLAPVIESLAEEGLDDCVFCKVDVDEESDFTAKMGIRSVPTVIVYKNGKAVSSFMGYRSKEQIIDIITSEN